MRFAGCLLVMLCIAGCDNKLAGDLKVDGKAFELDSCRSGQVYGFAGVELTAKDGRKLRLVQLPTGEANAVVIESGKATGAEVGACGAFIVKRQNSTINDITNVEGEAKLKCSTGAHTVEGAVSFKNCH